jgi:hypothetical protein
MVGLSVSRTRDSPGKTKQMTDKPDDNSIEESQNEQTTDSPNSTRHRRMNTADELVQENLDTFIELADSDVPIAEDAEKAIAVTDGGEDQ